MADEDRNGGAVAETPHAAAVGAAVGKGGGGGGGGQGRGGEHGGGAPPEAPAGWVVLYGADGRSLMVPEADVEARLAEGYTREVADPKALAKEFPQLLRVAEKAVREYARGVEADGVVDPADDAAKAVAERAMEEAVAAWGRLHRALQLRYPVTEGESAVATLDGGGEIRHDPSQVLMRRPDGQHQAVARAELALYKAVDWKVVHDAAADADR